MKINKYQWNRMTPKEQRQYEFKMYKDIVFKKYPNAILKCETGMYYVDDGFGTRVIPLDLYVNDSDTIFNAWKTAALSIDFDNIVERNLYKFSDDKLYESFEKKSKDKMPNDLIDNVNI